MDLEKFTQSVESLLHNGDSKMIEICIPQDDLDLLVNSKLVFKNCTSKLVGDFLIIYNKKRVLKIKCL